MDDSEDSRSLGEAILLEISEQTGVPPAEMNPPLFDVIDPDALETLFRGNTGHVSFEYHGFLVTVDHTGTVTVQPTESE